MIYRKKTFTKNEIQGQDFEDSTFESCVFGGLIFKFTNFNKCKFISCNFSESVFESAGFSQCKFPGSKLSFLDFGSASVTNCDFTYSIAKNCIFQKLKMGSKTERRNFDLRSFYFESADLSSSIFVMCNLEKVSFKKSILESSVFEKCNLKETDFWEASLLGCGFSDCVIKNTILDINGFVDYGNSKGFTLNSGQKT